MRLPSLVLPCVLLGCASAPGRAPAPQNQLDVRTNAITGETVLITRDRDVPHLAGHCCKNLSLHAVAVASPAASDSMLVGKVLLSFTSISTRWVYLESHDLTLLLDNSERIAGVSTARTGHVSAGVVTPNIDEEITAVLTREQFVHVASARTVAVQLGPGQFAFSDQTLMDFRLLAARLQAQAPAH